MKVESLTYLNTILTDVKAAVVVHRELGKLPKSIFSILSEMYGDVEITVPITSLTLSEEEKFNLTTTILEEMAIHFQNSIDEIVSGGNFGKKEHHTLALKVDPLWRELTSIYSEFINEEFNEQRPKSQEELVERIQVLEEITGLSRNEIKEKVGENPTLRKIIIGFGLLLTDL